MDVPIRFQVPYIGGSRMQMILSVHKGNVLRFTETKPFNVTDRGPDQTSDAVVAIAPDKVPQAPGNLRAI